MADTVTLTLESEEVDLLVWLLGYQSPNGPNGPELQALRKTVEAARQRRLDDAAWEQAKIDRLQALRGATCSTCNGTRRVPHPDGGLMEPCPACGVER